MPEALLVFLAPPSWDELERRLVGRGTEAPRSIAAPAGRAPGSSWRPRSEFDAVLVNDDVEARRRPSW